MIVIGFYSKEIDLYVNNNLDGLPMERETSWKLVMV